MAHGDNVLARLNRATGSPAAGAVLFRLLFWFEKGGLLIDGEKWVPNSISDWADEAGVSFKQSRSALAQFEKDHLAETKIIVYRGRKTMHTRPTERAKAIANGIFDEAEEVSPCPGGQGTLPQGHGTVPWRARYSALEGKVLYKEEYRERPRRKTLASLSARKT